jgi:hypothetical protein
LAVDFFAVDLVAVFLAGAFLAAEVFAAGDFFAVVDFDAVDFDALDVEALDFDVVDFAGAFFAVVDFDAVDLAGAFLAVDEVDFEAVLAGAFFAVVAFEAVDFDAVLAGAFLAVVDFDAVDFEALDFAGAFFAVDEVPDVAFFAAPAAARAGAEAALATSEALGSLGIFLLPETNALSSAPAVNLGTAVFLALIRSPVRGLRTHRASRTRFSNDPKPVIPTFSPRATSRVIVSRTDSRACWACFRLPS